MYIIFVRFNSIYTKMIIEELAGGKNNRLLQSFCWLFAGVYTCIYCLGSKWKTIFRIIQPVANVKKSKGPYRSYFIDQMIIV